MILADENLHTQFTRDLRQAGYLVLSVQEEYSGIADPAVITLALQ